jgi:uncharacterized membrane protein YhaH (DUF805 family)
MIAETKHCLRGLAQFKGRDDQPTFWYYVLALVIAQFIISMIVMVPMMIGLVNAIMQTIPLEQEGGDPAQAMGAVFSLMGPMMQDMMWISGATSLAMMLLFVAAFVRRLHDAGYTGWIVLVPIATQVFGLFYGMAQVEQMTEVMFPMMQTAMASNDPQEIVDLQAQMQGQIGPYGSVGMLGYLLVIVFGVMKSQAGPNRYGDAPNQV